MRADAQLIFLGHILYEAEFVVTCAPFFLLLNGEDCIMWRADEQSRRSLVVF